MTVNNQRMSRAHVESDKAFRKVMGWKVQENSRQYTLFVRGFLFFAGAVFILGGFLALYRFFKPL